MHYNDVIEKIGMTIDGAGVIVIVVGAVIAFGVAFVRLAQIGRASCRERV